MLLNYAFIHGEIVILDQYLHIRSKKYSFFFINIFVINVTFY